MENNKENIFLSDKLFPILVGILCATLVAGTHMYIVYGIGAFNEIFVVKMLDQGIHSGDYVAAAGFSAGFLLARVLEGPLVGLLDIGGSLMTGVGIGIPALMLASGWDKPLESFPLSLTIGVIVGILIGALIIAIRKVMPEGMVAGGTGIMMGAGNATGRFLGPLIILSAIQYNIPAGVGAFAGAALFYKYDRHIAGGAIIGAMLLGGLALTF